MAKKEIDKYWEKEKGELVVFGKFFMRCFDKAGKLQFGTVYQNDNTGATNYFVKFTLDKDALVNSDEGIEFLMQTLEDWGNGNDYED